ncbi:hypothetical protein M0811_03376 [Anaeramoeba ignava]|uniref:Kelch repeat-containing protein n=1 Tax=Anaeramoeba ignava TaxID=1746090 RepID=A0A9Q0R4F5_ANAIG|nr:hypothetical protein M0811_03376 [Anaeramoeba ignava]
MTDFDFCYRFQNWQKIEPEDSIKPKPVAKCGIASTRNEIFIHGGNDLDTDELIDQFCSFSFLTNTWTQHSPKGDKPPLRVGHSMCGFEDRLWVGFGYNKTEWFNDIYEYNVETNTFKKIPTNSAPLGRYSFTFLYHKGSIYLFGGVPKSGKRLNDTWRFNLQTEQWQELHTTGNIPKGRSSHTSAIYRDSMVIFGGLDYRIRRNNDIHLLDLNTLVWTEINASPAYFEIQPKFESQKTKQPQNPQQDGASGTIVRPRFLLQFDPKTKL